MILSEECKIRKKSVSVQYVEQADAENYL